MQPRTIFLMSSKYLFTKSSDHFIGFISKTTMVAMALGVAVLIVVLSVMNGFSLEFEKRILSNIPHALLIHQGSVGLQNWEDKAEALKKQNSHIKSVMPLSSTQAIFLTLNGGAGFGNLNGVKPLALSKIGTLKEDMIQGSIESLNQTPYGVILGSLLAESLGVGLGDKVNLMVPKVHVSLLGLQPRLRQFTVFGIFDTHSEIDKNTALIHLRDYNSLLGKPKDEVRTLSIQFKNPINAPEYTKELQQKNPKSYFLNWTQSFGSLYAAISMEKRIVGLLLFSIIVVAAFNVLATLVMIIKEKQKEIAILRTMGMRRIEVLSVFVLLGVFIGTLGCVIGGALGVALALSIEDIFLWAEKVFSLNLLNSDTYFINYLPSELNIKDLISVFSGTLAIAMLATIYPAFRAASIKPADVLNS